MSDNDSNDEFERAEQAGGDWDDEQHSDDDEYWLCNNCEHPNGLTYYINNIKKI